MLLVHPLQPPQDVGHVQFDEQTFCMQLPAQPTDEVEPGEQTPSPEQPLQPPHWHEPPHVRVILPQLPQLCCSVAPALQTPSFTQPCETHWQLELHW